MQSVFFRVAGLTVAIALAAASPADARTWSWTYTDPGMQAHGLSSATLDLGSTQIKTSNRIPVAGHPDVVYTCTVLLEDVSRAIAVHAGTTSLLIALKPDRTANCQVIGHPQSIVLRSDDGGAIDRIAGAINDACCTVAAAPAPPSRPSLVPQARPSLAPPAHAAARSEPTVVRTVPRPSEKSPEPTATRPPAVAGNAGPRLVRAGLSEPIPGKNGSIQIRVSLGPDGSPQDAAVLSSSNDDLDDAGVEIAASSTYAPAVRRGRPVASDFILTIEFRDGTPNVSATVSRRQ